jgi:hypothetical protein
MLLKLRHYRLSSDPDLLPRSGPYCRYHGARSRAHELVPEQSDQQWYHPRGEFGQCLHSRADYFHDSGFVLATCYDDNKRMSISIWRDAISGCTGAPDSQYSFLADGNTCSANTGLIVSCNVTELFVDAATHVSPGGGGGSDSSSTDNWARRRPSQRSRSPACLLATFLALLAAKEL